MTTETSIYIAAQLSPIFNCETCPHRSQKVIDIVHIEDHDPVPTMVSFCTFGGVHHPTAESMTAIAENTIMLSKSCRIIELIAPIIDEENEPCGISPITALFMIVPLLLVILHFK